MVPKTICVDFDGTICEFAYPAIGALKPGVREALRRFKELGYYIIIYSCRAAIRHKEKYHPGCEHLPGLELPSVKVMKQFLDEQQIPYDEIDSGESGKPVADFYIDDKAVRFEDNWAEVQSFVEKNTMTAEQDTG